MRGSGEESDRPFTGGKTRELRAGRGCALHHNEQITCRCCENDIGIATSMAVRVMLVPRRTPRGRLVPGTEEGRGCNAAADLCPLPRAWLRGAAAGRP
jgi:hypothetical protein